MVQPDPHDEQRLAQAIRFGARRRPNQAFGEYYRGTRSSCALGAAYEAVYRLPPDVNSMHPKRLDWFFACLEGTLRRCPLGCKKTLALAAIIVHLNDRHQWTREQIAEWVVAPAPADPTQAPLWGN